MPFCIALVGSSGWTCCRTGRNTVCGSQGEPSAACRCTAAPLEDPTATAWVRPRGYSSSSQSVSSSRSSDLSFFGEIVSIAPPAMKSFSRTFLGSRFARAAIGSIHGGLPSAGQSSPRR
jgi:hypothetical protein